MRDRCCDERAPGPALLKSTESAVRAIRALQSELFADECLQSNFDMDADAWVRSWQLCSMTPMSTLDQFKVLSLSDPNDRLRLVAEICCERYGDYQRMVAIDSSPPTSYRTSNRSTTKISVSPGPMTPPAPCSP